MPPSKELNPKVILEGNSPPSVLLVEDQGFVRKERFIKKYIEVFCDNQKRDLERYDARSLNEKDLKLLQGSSQSYSLFSESKVILITNIDELETAASHLLAKILEKVSNDTYFILSSSPLLERSILRKAIAKFGSIITFDELKGAELRRWIQREFNSHGIKNLQDGVLEKIADLSKGDIDTAAKQIELVSLYAQTDSVTTAEIKEVLTSNAELQEFVLLESIVEGNSKRSTILLYPSLKAGLNIFGFLSLAAKNSLHLSTLFAYQKQGISTEKLKVSLGLTPWIANKLHQTAKRTNSDFISKLARKLLRADIRLKSKSVVPSDVLQGIIDR